MTASQTIIRTNRAEVATHVQRGPYSSIADTVCREAGKAFEDWYNQPGEEPEGEPPALLTISEFRERCAPLIAEIWGERAA